MYYTSEPEDALYWQLHWYILEVARRSAYGVSHQGLLKHYYECVMKQH